MTITLTLRDLYAILLIVALLGGTIAVYGVRFLAWSDARRAVGDDLGVDEYEDAAKGRRLR